MDGGVVAQVRASTVQQEREKTLMQRCNMQLASTVWWNNGRIVKSSKPKPKDKWTYANKKGRQGSIEPSGVRQQTSIGIGV